MALFVESGSRSVHSSKERWEGSRTIPVISVWIVLIVFSGRAYAQERETPDVPVVVREARIQEQVAPFDSPFRIFSDQWLQATKTEASRSSPMQHPFVLVKMDYHPSASNTNDRVSTRKRKWIWIGVGALITGGVAVVLLANRTPGDLPEPPPLPQSRSISFRAYCSL